MSVSTLSHLQYTKGLGVGVNSGFVGPVQNQPRYAEPCHPDDACKVEAEFESWELGGAHESSRFHHVLNIYVIQHLELFMTLSFLLL